MKKEFITNIPTNPISRGSISKYRKENHFNYSLFCLAVNSAGEITTAIESRFYHTKVRSYCVTWIHLPDYWLNGGSYAQGHGSHLDSASLEYALTACGIGVKDLEGRGNHAMETALLELAQKLSDQFNLGYSNFTIIKAHG